MSQAKPTIRQLEYFVAVADLNHFRKAADRLNVSQPTLTSQISALENSLQQSLFERSRHGTQLSVQGRQLLTQARRVLEEMEALVKQASSQENGFDSTYTLGVSPTVGPYYLPYVIPQIHKAHEAFQFYIREKSPTALEDELLHGKLDIILTTQALSSDDFAVTPLFKEEVKLVVPSDHPLAQFDEIEISQLRNQNVLSLDRYHPLHHKVGHLCDSVGAKVLHDYEGTSLDALRQMAVMGMGIAFLPQLYIDSEMKERDELKVVDLSDYKMFRQHTLAWRHTSPNRNLFKNIADEIRTITQHQLGHLISVSD